MKELLAQGSWCFTAGDTPQQRTPASGRSIGQCKERQLPEQVFGRLVKTMTKGEPEGWMSWCIGVGHRCGQCTFAHAGQPADCSPTLTLEPLRQPLDRLCAQHITGG